MLLGYDRFNLVHDDNFNNMWMIPHETETKGASEDKHGAVFRSILNVRFVCYIRFDVQINYEDEESRQ